MALSDKEKWNVLEHLYNRELDELYNGSEKVALDIGHLRGQFKRLIIKMERNENT